MDTETELQLYISCEKIQIWPHMAKLNQRLVRLADKS